MTKKKVVVLGAGYGGVYTFDKLRHHFAKSTRVDLLLVSKTNYFVSTPLLHEVATGAISPEHITEPLRKILRCDEDEFMLTDVTGVSMQNKEVHTMRGPIPYDYLVVALGSQTAYWNTPGAKENTITLKTLEDAVRMKGHFIRAFEHASTIADDVELAQALRFVVIGGGATGVELVSEISDMIFDTFARFYSQRVMEAVEVVLINSGDELLQNFSRSIRTRSKSVLRHKGINVKFGVKVTEARPHELTLNTGEVIKSDTIIWAAGVEPVKLDIDMPLEKERGRIVVNEYLQVPGHPEIFVMGDMASFRNKGSDASLPMLAQVAHRQSVGVARNIINMIEGRKVEPYFYKHWGDLVSLGEWVAAGELFGFKIFGHFAWFFWRGVYLSKLLSASKKAKVLLDWIVEMFRPRDISSFSPWDTDK